MTSWSGALALSRIHSPALLPHGNWQAERQHKPSSCAALVQLEVPTESEEPIIDDAVGAASGIMTGSRSGSSAQEVALNAACDCCVSAACSRGSLRTSRCFSELRLAISVLFRCSAGTQPSAGAAPTANTGSSHRADASVLAHAAIIYDSDDGTRKQPPGHSSCCIPAHNLQQAAAG